MNAPDRFELFILDEDEKKVTWELDTRVPNTAVFTFNKEDHTLGNLISARLHKYEHIRFSAYKIPHPLFAKFELRVTTDGSVTPKEAVLLACRDAIADLKIMGQIFAREWNLKQLANDGDQR